MDYELWADINRLLMAQRNVHDKFLQNVSIF